jgi:3-hydroxyisobutyrate dehydrogenase
MMDTSPLQVGVIGIGAFGSRVALRLLWNGYPALQLYDVNDVSTRQFTNEYGGLTTGSPKMMAQTCDVVIAVLPTAADLREVCFGWENLTKGFTEGGIVINLGIADPLEIVRLGSELGSRGIALLDAPAFGTPPQAKEGSLELLVGGEERAFERARPVLKTLASRVERLGEAGGPQALGAIADYLHGVELMAATEAIRLGQRFGLDADAILQRGHGAGPSAARTILRSEVLTRRFQSGRSLGMISGNIELAAKLCAALGVVSPILQHTRTAWSEAGTLLGSGADHTAIIRWLETLQPADLRSADLQPGDAAPVDGSLAAEPAKQ